MTRNLKLSIVLGIAVLASAVVAPAASAWDFLHEEKGAEQTELLDGKSKVKWNFTIGQFECAEHGAGSAEALETTEDLYALTSDECSGEQQVQVVVNGCEWDYITSAVNFVGTANFVCGKAKLEYKIPGCTITVPSQNGLSSFSFTNLDGPGKLLSEKEVTVDIKVTNLQYEEDNVAPGNSCKKAGMLQKTGTITGPKILTDENKTTKAMKGLAVG